MCFLTCFKINPYGGRDVLRHKRLLLTSVEKQLAGQRINVNEACVTEETLVIEIAPATDMASTGTEMSATDEFSATD